MKSTRMQYCIKAVPSDDTFQMESLLNEMSSLGWELYTMHEVEGDEGFNYNCIFVKNAKFQQKPKMRKKAFTAIKLKCKNDFRTKRAV